MSGSDVAIVIISMAAMTASVIGAFWAGRASIARADLSKAKEAKNDAPQKASDKVVSLKRGNG